MTEGIERHFPLLFSSPQSVSGFGAMEHKTISLRFVDCVFVNTMQLRPETKNYFQKNMSSRKSGVDLFVHF